MNVRIPLACAFGALTVFLTHSSVAATRTWNGGGSDNLWSNAANWGGIAPEANDALVFSGNTTLLSFNDFAAGTTFGTITFAAGSGPYVLTGNDFIANGNFSIPSGSNSAQIVKLNYQMPGPQTFSMSSNTFLQLDGVISGVAGGVNLQNGGTLKLTRTNTYGGISKVDNGVLMVSSIGSIGGSGNLGAPIDAANGTISLAASTGVGTLFYTGSGETTDRVINLGGAASSGVTGNPTFNRGLSVLNQSGTGHLKFLSDLTATTVGNKGLVLAGSTAGTGEIAGAIVDPSGNLTTVNKLGTGTWTMSGNNTYTGATSLNGGTLRLNYDVGAGGTNTSKLSDTGNFPNGGLNLAGGTLELVGGSHTEVVPYTAITGGTSFITRTGGTSVLNMGYMDSFAQAGATTTSGTSTVVLADASMLKVGMPISGAGIPSSSFIGAIVGNTVTLVNFAGTTVNAAASGTVSVTLGTTISGAVNFSASNIATTTTGNTNGILSQRATVAGADFAANDGSNNIVAYTDYTGFVGTMATNTNYSLSGNGSIAGAVGAATNTLKITTTASGQSLALGANTLTAGAILFAGADDYAISTTGAGKVSATVLHNYGTGDLYLGALGTGLIQYGTGKTILTAATATANGPFINGGTVQFSDNLQLVNNSSTRVITLNNGTLLADTTAGSIALNNAGTSSRNFTINEGGGTIDVIGGNSLIVSGAIGGTGRLAFGSSSSNGTIVLTGVNTYTGQTFFNGGIINLGVAESVGTGGPLGKPGASAAPESIFMNGGTIQYSAANQYDYSYRFSTGSEQKFNVDTNGQNVTWSAELISEGGSLTKSGSGNLTLTAANTYTGTTAVSAGTLILSGQGSIANSAAIDLESGGTLDVAGVAGGFSLADGQTLRGSGSVIGDVTLSSGSTLSIGNSPGTMTFSDDLTLSGGSMSDFEIDGLTAGFFDLAQGDVGSQTVTFGGTLNLLFQAGFNTVGSVQIFDFENYIGSFSATNISGLAGGYSATFDELTGTVTVSVIPEPSTWLLVLGGLTMVTVLRRRLR